MFCLEYIQLPRGLKMISNSLPLLNYPLNSVFQHTKKMIENLGCVLFFNQKALSSKTFITYLLVMSKDICRRNFMEIWSACRCVILLLISRAPPTQVVICTACAFPIFREKGYILGAYCIRHIFRESNFSRIGNLRHFREWLNSRSRRAMYCVHKSHSCVGIGGKYFRVLINSRIAPDSQNSRK